MNEPPTHPMDIIHLCIITDEGYAVPSTVMLTSAKLHKKKESLYIVHCLCNGASSFAKQKLLELNADDFHIRIIDCNADKYSGLKMPPNITASTMIKCDLPEILPNVDKLLMIDGDIIVKSDLAELWQTEMGDNLVAAVADMVGTVDMGYDKLLEIDTYFNAGVMVLNLGQMRQEKTGQIIIETKMNAPATWEWGEQDPFNKVCDGRLVKLPLKWNMTATNFLYNHHNIAAINQFFNTSYINFTEMEDDASIIHFNAYKPWKSRLMPYACLWQKYHDVSPYGDTNLEHIDNYPNLPKTTISKIRFLSCIPLLSIKDTSLRTDCYLFGCLKLYKIKKRNQQHTLLLFGFIPILSISRQTLL